MGKGERIGEDEEGGVLGGVWALRFGIFVGYYEKDIIIRRYICLELFFLIIYYLFFHSMDNIGLVMRTYLHEEIKKKTIIFAIVLFFDEFMKVKQHLVFLLFYKVSLEEQ